MKSVFNLTLLFLCLGLVTVSCKNDAKKKTENAKTEQTEQKTTKVTGSNFSVEPATSKVMWIGSKPSGKHNGTINVKGGDIVVKDGQIIDGEFKLDMNSIAVLDLDGKYKKDLEDHLKGTNSDDADHFFNVSKYPEARFEITKVTKRDNDPEATHSVYGNLVMKGITKPVSFGAKVDITEEGIHVTTPTFKINRTDWGINYKSKSFFDDLKDKFIYDDIELNVDLKARG